jgi:hypothetical protein
MMDARMRLRPAGGNSTGVDLLLWLPAMKLLSLFVFSVVAGAGCAVVKPYQRELLAQPGMSFELTADGAIEQHMLEAREGSAGGFGASGGGCGCN